jgi:hypothetical protein
MEMKQFNAQSEFAHMTMQVLLLFSFFALLFLAFYSCNSTGVMVTGKTADALKEAEAQYPDYEFTLAPATVGTRDGKYVILCEVNGEWIKVATGSTEDLPEEKTKE